MERKSHSKCVLCRREGKKLFLKGDKCNSPKMRNGKQKLSSWSSW